MKLKCEINNNCKNRQLIGLISLIFLKRLLHPKVSLRNLVSIIPSCTVLDASYYTDSSFNSDISIFFLLLLFEIPSN